MDAVKVDRYKLIIILKENKEKHIKEFEETLKGYKDVLSKRLRKLDKLIKKDEDFSEAKADLNSLVEPQSYEKDYTGMLKMLEMCVDDIIELSSSDFDRYVLDEWHWKGHFSTVSKFYSGNNG